MSDVIDFKAALEKRRDKEATVEVQFEAKELNIDVDSEVELLEDWYQNFNGEVKIPKFRTLDSVFNYLILQIMIPYDVETARQWFKDRHPLDQANVLMLAHYTKALGDNMVTIREHLKRYAYHNKSPNAYKTMKYIMSEVEQRETIIRILTIFAPTLERTKV